MYKQITMTQQLKAALVGVFREVVLRYVYFLYTHKISWVVYRITSTKDIQLLRKLDKKTAKTELKKTTNCLATE